MSWTLKRSGIFGIINIALILISVFLSAFIISIIFSNMSSDILNSTNPFSALNQTTRISFIFLAVIGFISTVVSIGFLSGFIILGRKFNNKLLLYSTWIFITFGVLFSILNLVFVLSDKGYELAQAGFLESSISSSSPFLGYILNILPEGLGFPFAIIFITSAVILVLSFGIGIYKLKSETKLAEWAGTFEIAKLIPFVSFLGFVATILEVIMFFKLSKKYNE